MSTRSIPLGVANALPGGVVFGLFLTACAPQAAPSTPSALGALTARSGQRLERKVKPPTSYAQLYSFAGGTAGDGSDPNSGLIDIGGTFYGTTDQGGGTGCGGSGCGTVFKMTPGGSETVIYAFAGGADGAYPIGLVDVGGTLYGTTFGGGNSDCNGIGCGTVFKITTSGTETVLLTFANQQNYDFGPSTAPVSIGGVLYFGTRGVPDQSGGCRYGCGTIDSLTKKGTQSIVYSFKAGSDGAGPDSLIDVGGTLYGTTIEGGGSASCFDGCGIVFQVTTAGTETVLHSFGSGTDGQVPTGGLTNVSGTLYGTTYEGGTTGVGTVFKVSTAGAESVVHNFGCGADGGYPVASPTKVGSILYGTTAGCGSGKFGTIYKLTKAGAETVLYDFAGVPDGDEPQGLTNLGGTLYGTAELGGTGGCGSLGCGTFFSFSP